MKGQGEMAQVEGSAGQLEQLLRTQLQLPAILLTKNFKATIEVIFQVDEKGKPYQLRFKGVVNNLIRTEITRILPLLTYKRTNPGTEVYLPIELSTERYRQWEKFRKQHALKSIAVADTSLIIYTRADRSPDYYDKGEDGLNTYFQENLEYPQSAIDHSIQGVVILEFVVEANGFVTNIHVKQGITGGCTDEAVRLISETRWTPALVSNKAVRYKMTYPITFTLQNKSRSGQAYGQ